MVDTNHDNSLLLMGHQYGEPVSVKPVELRSTIRPASKSHNLGLLFRRRRSQSSNNLDLVPVSASVPNPTTTMQDSTSTHSSMDLALHGATGTTGDVPESMEETIRVEKAFWTAVEREDCETVKSILSQASKKGLVNRVNAFGLQPLDMACVLGLETMMMLLLEQGATNNPVFFANHDEADKDRLVLHINRCIQELSEQLSRLRESQDNAPPGQREQMSTEVDFIEEDNCILRNARYGLQALPLPREPPSVEVEVVSTTALLVIVQAPSSEYMVTQYLIQWNQVTESGTGAGKSGSLLVSAHYPQGLYDIDQLESDKTYSVRVHSWNLCGYSKDACNGKPAQVRLSTWFSQAEHRDRSTSDDHMHELNAMQGEIQQELCTWLTSNNTSADSSRNGVDNSSQNHVRSKSPPTGPGGSLAPVPITATTTLHRKKTFRQLFSMGTSTIASTLPGSGSSGSGSGVGSGSASGGTSASTFAFKLLRHIKAGVYIAVLYSNGEKMLMLEEALPFFQVDSDEAPGTVQSDAHWLMRLLASQLDLKILSQNLTQLFSDLPTSLQLRVKLLLAAQQLQAILGSVALGEILPEVVCGSRASVLLLVQHQQASSRDLTTSLLTISNNLKWTPVTKLARRIQPCPTGLEADHLSIPSSSTHPRQLSAEEEVYAHLEEIVQRHSGKVHDRLSPGLYVAYLRLRLLQDQLQILHPVNMLNILPTSIIRDNNHVTREEWEALRCLATTTDACRALPETMRVFVRTVHIAWNKLATALRLQPEEREECRMYLGEVFTLGHSVSLLIVTHGVDSVCLNQQNNDEVPWSPMDFHFSHFAAFEHWLFLTYEHTFYSLYASLSSILEVLLPLAQKCQRQSFHDAEVRQNRHRVEIFLRFQQRLEEIWTSKRWTKDIIVQSRGMKSDIPSVEGGIASPAIPQWLSIYTMSEAIESWYAYKSVGSSALGSPLTPTSILKEHDSTFNTPSSGNVSRKSSFSSLHHVAAINNAVASQHPNPSEASPPHASPGGANKVLQGSLRIYAGYPCGLVEGTSVRLQVTSVTTAREIVNLVVRKLAQLRSSGTGASGPSGLEDELSTYCLRVSLGKVEKHLPDHFHPLLLQPPWSKGKLLIRRRSDPEEEMSQDSV